MGDARASDASSERPEGRTAARSYRGRSLDGADFDGRDVRGADFSGASLRSASFRHARIGVAPRVGVALLAAGITVAIAAGVAIGWAVDQLRDQVGADEWDRVAEGGSIGVTVLVIVGVTLWRGFDVAVRLAVVFWVVVVVLNVLANLIWDEVEPLIILRATALLLMFFFAIGAGMLGRVVGGVFGAWSVALVAVLGGLASGRAHGGIAGVVVALSLAIVSKRALRGDERDRTLRRLGHLLIRRWGTQFLAADLTGADFTGSDASQCDARDAIVDDVTWDPEHPLPLDVLPR
jgi:hypothetical protein